MTHEAVVRSRGGRLLRGTTAAVGLVVPVVLLAFAVRHNPTPIITADNAAIRTFISFSRTHELTFALLVVQQVTQPVVHRVFGGVDRDAGWRQQQSNDADDREEVRPGAAMRERMARPSCR